MRKRGRKVSREGVEITLRFNDKFKYLSLNPNPNFEFEFSDGKSFVIKFKLENSEGLKYLLLFSNKN